MRILSAAVLATFGFGSTVALAATVDAIYNSATDVPVTASGYTATGDTVNFTLNFAPVTGTDLMVVQNTGLGFINGTFDNLTNGQGVALSYAGTTCNFVATYYGGSGNDLVLLWANHRAFAWGWNGWGGLGDNTTTNRLAPVAVETNPESSALFGKTVVATTAGESHSLALSSDGTVAAWGGNEYGQLGNNTTTNRSTPVAVNTTALAAGQRFSRLTSGPSAYHTLALVAAPPASAITLAGAQTLTDGSFQFAFTNTPGAFFGVLASTNPALPMNNWATLGDATEVSPGLFQFTDPQATNSPQRFYRVRSP